MGRTADYSNESCTIAATLKVIGDPWTLLVIRDAFNGVRRFEQWQEHLGVARNVLASRLKSLVSHGVLEPHVYTERPLRHEYLLTRKGKDLYAVLLTLHGWGSKHLYGEAGSGLSFVHRTCGHELEPILSCGACMEPVKPRDLEIRMSPGRRTVGQVLGGDEAA